MSSLAEGTGLAPEPGMREARARDRVKAIRSNLASTFTLLAEAWELEDWKTLGYESWGAYIDGEFRDHGMTKLRKTERVAAVAMLREAGMSTRAIAAATGESQSTVSRDVRAGESNGSPVQGTDGKTYRPSRPGSAEDADMNRLRALARPALPAPDAEAPAPDTVTVTLTLSEQRVLASILREVTATRPAWFRKMKEDEQVIIALRGKIGKAGQP